VIGPFTNDGGPMWFSKMIEWLHNWRLGGQLGESGEYLMGRKEIGLI
jgi:hypothetical protein